MAQAVQNNQTKEGAAGEYIKTLEAGYTAAKNTYKEAKANADKLRDILSRAESWETMLKSYLEAVVETNRLAGIVIAGFEKTTERTGVVCTNADYAYKAFQWMVDCMINVTSEVEQFKISIDNFLIRLSNAPDSNPLLVYLKKLQAAVAEALKCLLEALKMWLEVLKTSKILADHVGNKAGVGFDSLIQLLLTSFKGEKVHLPYVNEPVKLSSACVRPEESGSRKRNANNDSPCTDYWATCIVPSRPAIPLIPEDGCEDTSMHADWYACITKAELAQVQKCLTGLRCQHSIDEKAMVEALAKMNSLGKALEVARATNGCKN